MTPDARALADELGIREAIHYYSIGMDERRWELWDRSFTPDGIIDFSPMAGRTEPISSFRERLDVDDPSFVFAQHPVSNTVIDVHGDGATAHSEYTWESGKLAKDSAAGALVRISGGGSYDDELVRTEAGWRIKLRRVSLKWKETRVTIDEAKRG
ncbi:MAG: hypothetical protein JWQ19_3830 [Subtercola sp.]|nr:hypothetical protein [Subtercola sp.]